MVSIIICFYERLSHLKCCLDSLALQTQDFDEIVITDDGSSTATVNILKQLIKKYDFAIRHVWQEKNGFRVAAARNNGIKNSKGDYLIFFDCDMLILPGTVKKHTNEAKRKRFIAGNCKYLSQQQTEQIFTSPISAEIMEKFYNELPETNLLKEHHKFKKRTFFIRLSLMSPKKQSLGGHFSIHREDIESVNGYDENFVGWGGEDENLGIRLASAGIHCVSAIPFARVLHIWHPKEMGNKHWREGKNIDYLNRKNVPYYCPNGLNKS
jgi:glycosyltransferase involved in cell wall biosynthesis